jgi:hypothetical protein
MFLMSNTKRTVVTRYIVSQLVGRGRWGRVGMFASRDEAEAVFSRSIVGGAPAFSVRISVARVAVKAAR